MHEDDRSTRPPRAPGVEEPEPQAQRSEVGLATITLRQIRVSRAEVHDKQPPADANPMNRLVPYLDLFACLNDDELGRLAEVPTSVVGDLRRQVIQVDRALARFAELLPRLSDPEMVRLTGATPKTIRFWRLCQPRHPLAGSTTPGWSVHQAAEALGRGMLPSAAPVERVRRPPSGLHPAISEEPPLDSGAPLDGRGGSSAYRMPTAERDGGSSAYRMPTAEREGGSSAYRMPTAERDGGSSAYRMPTAEREGGSSAYRMPTAERDAGPARRTFEPPPPPPPSTVVSHPVDLSRPRTGRTQENPAITATKPTRTKPPPPPPASPPPELVQRQQAVAQQMTFSGAPFPGYDSEGSGSMGEDDGIFIGLELPDPRTLTNSGRRD